MRSRHVFHLTESAPAAWPYHPSSLESEGFVHGSFADRVRDTASVYFGGRTDLHLLCLDPRRLGARLEVADTPRGAMPHVYGPIPRDAVAWSGPLSGLELCPDRVLGTRFGFVAFRGMTLLDLVGAYDPIARIAGMGFDPTTRAEVLAAHEGPLWAADGASFRAARVRPPLVEFDVLVVPGGPGARALASDEGVLAWLRGFPTNRLAVSVCTGALLLGAAGRLAGRRATTHASALAGLATYGAAACADRVVDAGDVITGGGVSCALDVGLHVVRELAGEGVARSVAEQMAWR